MSNAPSVSNDLLSVQSSNFNLLGSDVHVSTVADKHTPWSGLHVPQHPSVLRSI